jgi:hypothetical protein
MAFIQASKLFDSIKKNAHRLVGRWANVILSWSNLTRIMPEIIPPTGPNGPKPDTVAGLSIPELAGQNLAYTEEIAQLKSRVHELRMSQSFGAPPPKFFLVSKGFLGGSLTILLSLSLAIAESLSVTAWDIDHSFQLARVAMAVAVALAAALGLYGRVGANAPLKFWLED